MQDKCYPGQSHTCMAMRIAKAQKLKWGPHRLCSHGGFDHLWCIPARLVWPQHQSEPWRITVEGYIDGLGLDTHPREMVCEELDAIRQQYELPYAAAHKTCRGYLGMP